MKESIVTTLGHIDHGKSSLVQALSGIDPDRLKEEKRRGITLDLGYAYFDQGDHRIAIVDVPGHEDLIKNMLVGMSGIQAGLMVIAADQGLMPQSKEHFYIAELLGLKRGVIALTRCDLSDPETTAMVMEEVKEFVAGSFLKDAPILTCSSKTGEGIKEIKAALCAGWKELPQGQAPFIMPIDRSFSLKGFGSIVAGNVAQGEYKEGGELQLFPDQTPVNIRGMQSQHQATSLAHLGKRVAFNLKNLTPEEAPRGKILASPKAMAVTKEAWVSVTWLPHTKDKIKNKHSLLAFVGGQESVIILKRKTDWPEGLWLLRADKTLSLRFSEKLILRSFSLNETWGGAVVLNLLPQKKLNAEILPLIAGLKEKPTRLEHLILLSGAKGLEASEIIALSGLTTKEITKGLKELSAKRLILTINQENKKYYHQKQLRLWGGYLKKVTEQFHQDQPETIGVKSEYFKGKFLSSQSQKEINEILDWLVKENYLVKFEQYYHLKDFKEGLPAELKKAKSDVLESLKELGFKCITEQTLLGVTQLKPKELKRLVQVALAEGWLIKAKEKHYFSNEAVARAWAALHEYFSKEKQITVITFKELLAIARKEAILLLELFDQEGRTQRDGDKRRLR